MSIHCCRVTASTEHSDKPLLKPFCINLIPQDVKIVKMPKKSEEKGSITCCERLLDDSHHIHEQVVALALGS